MIGFFPEPYRDELLFSCCSRYAEMAGYQTMRAVCQDLFRSNRFRVSVDFPSRLKRLTDALPPGHHVTTDRLINDHTLLPFFAPFVSAKRLAVIKAKMAEAALGALHGSLGVNTFKGKLKVFRYCPRCVESDRFAYRETYWHRSHHVFGVNVCVLHQCFLRNTELPLRSNRRLRAFVTAEAALLDADLTPSYEQDGRLLTLQIKLAENTAWLLQHPVFAGYEKTHRNHYVHLLYERGYCTYGGVLDRQKLANDLISYYSLEFLETLKCEVVTDGREDWANRFVHRKQRLNHPIHHLLLLQFLNQNLDSFLNAPYRKAALPKAELVSIKKEVPRTVTPFVDAPFGQAPWPCLNPVSNHFQQDVVTVCEIQPTQLHPRRPRGTFRCECGFAYSRVGPDQTESDRLRRDRYVAFGEQWDNALCEGLKRREHYRVIKKRLGVNEKTMLRRMFTLGLKTARGRTITHHPYATRTPKKFVDRRRILVEVLKRRRTSKRREFLDVRKANPKLSRSKLHEVCVALYSWLYKHDRPWLEKHLPARCPGVTIAKSIWSERDATLAAAVLVEAERVRALPGRPVMITATLIAHSLEIGYVCSKRAHVLPLTNKALKEVAETCDQVAVRRVEWATACFEHQGLSPAAWRIAVQAGLNGKAAKRPVIKAALDKAVAFLKSQMELNYAEADAA